MGDGTGKPSTKGRGRKGMAHYSPEETDKRFRVPPSMAMPKRVFLICHYCGYSPEGDLPARGSCPKCGGFSWERFALAEPLVPSHMRN